MPNVILQIIVLTADVRWDMKEIHLFNADQLDVNQIRSAPLTKPADKEIVSIHVPLKILVHQLQFVSSAIISPNADVHQDWKEIQENVVKSQLQNLSVELMLIVHQALRASMSAVPIRVL